MQCPITTHINADCACTREASLDYGRPTVSSHTATLSQWPNWSVWSLGQCSVPIVPTDGTNQLVAPTAKQTLLPLPARAVAALPSGQLPTATRPQAERSVCKGCRVHDGCASKTHEDRPWPHLLPRLVAEQLVECRWHGVSDKCVRCAVGHHTPVPT